MLVPEGCDAHRSISFSERTLRRGIAIVAAVVAIVLLGAGVALGREAVRDGWLSAESPVRQDGALAERLRMLDDTIAAIAHRNDQIRLLAGLPADTTATPDSAATAEPAPGAVATPGIRLAGLANVDGLIARANLLAASFASVSDTLRRNVDKLARIPSIMPTAGWLSSAFSKSRYHPILHYARPHEGIDVSAPMGAPIVAPAAGTVTLVTVERGYGNVLEIDHGNGIVTKYAHCSRIVVRVGQHVSRGQEIANVGSTGLSTGPHLHYEIHVHGKVVNPLTYVMPSDAIVD